MRPQDQTPEPERVDDREERRLARMLFWVGMGLGVAFVGTALAYTAIRIVASGRHEDPTTHRIQELIDEANSLLKALDEQRSSA